MKRSFEYIYGPVPSWRLGSSLGIDLLSQKDKICNFDCIYCQIGHSRRLVCERKVYVHVGKIIDELDGFSGTKADYITFSGRGEPTLAVNLGEAIKAVRLIRKNKIAVLTNSVLIGQEDVRKDLALADFVVAKLDACSQESLGLINRPEEKVEFSGILEGIKEFRKNYLGRLALQIMFLRDNRQSAGEYAYLAKCINPDEIQVNTPLRHCNVEPLGKEEILRIKEYFISACKGVNIVSVYDERKMDDVRPISDAQTLKRRGKRK
ncbi:MAG: radical SAM protein [Candidatus Omnitrophica bacterium]|nr:radical SAM protein [Candidatus Omnitrophota bacterium]